MRRAVKAAKGVFFDFCRILASKQEVFEGTGSQIPPSRNTQASGKSARVSQGRMRPGFCRGGTIGSPGVFNAKKENS